MDLLPVSFAFHGPQKGLGSWPRLIAEVTAPNTTIRVGPYEPTEEDEVPPGGEADAPLPWVTWTPYTYPFNLSGQPALSLPCGFDTDGLPIGLQIIGPWGADDLIMELAQRFERVLGRPKPALPA